MNTIEGMDELQIAEAMAAGTVESPQVYQNLHLFAMRITGTGMAYRTAWKEYVWRDSSLYLSHEFLKRCNGLPVIWEHPPTGTLDSKEFVKRIIGTIMLPYIKGDEVWGIAKILDEDAGKAMTENQLSTSPAVVMRQADSEKRELEDGVTLLIEGKPTLLDHLAVCAVGVWDKAGPPVGITNDTLSPERTDASMAEQENKTAADAGGDIPDKHLTGLDAFTSKLDACMAKMDADAEERRKDAEDRKADSERRRSDAEEWDKKRQDWDNERKADAARKDSDKEDKKDDADDKKDDAVEEPKKDSDDKKPGEPEEPAADKRGDSNPPTSGGSATMADAIPTQEIIDRAVASAIAALKLPAREDSEAYRSETFGKARADAERVYQAFGETAPTPYDRESEISYRARVADHFKKHSKSYSGVDFHKASKVLDAPAFARMESEVYADAVAASRSVEGVPDGQLISTQRVDPETGHRITEWRGRTTVFKQFSTPPMYATKFMTERRA